MTASLWRWRLVPLIGALLLAGVASVAYAMGVATTNAPAAQAAQPTTIPGHPELGPGWTAPCNLRGAAGERHLTQVGGQHARRVLKLRTGD